MALRNGVLLQSERFWAAAVRSPGGGVNVTSGEKPRIPARHSLQRVPLLRGLLRLGESLAVLPAVRRSTGGPVLPQEDPRLLAATAASAVATLALRSSRRGSPLLKECLLYTSDAADDLLCVDLGGRRIIKKKKILTTHH